MRSNNMQQSEAKRDLAFDRLQNVILQLATRPAGGIRRERSDDFKRLVEQALAAYRNYMRAVTS